MNMNILITMLVIMMIMMIEVIMVKILGETDKCCFCEYDCPSPSEQEEKDRESGFGILDSLWDHIEQSHPLAYEWIS